MIRSTIKTNALATLGSDAEKRTTLAKALAFQFGILPLILGVMGEKAAYAFASNDASNTPGVRHFGGVKAAAPEVKDFEAALRAKYATPDQNPNLTAAAQKVQEWYHTNMPELDLGWLPLFDLVDLRGTQHDTFEINTTGAGIVWRERKAGAKTEIRREFTEGTLPVKMIEISAGVGLLDVWLQFNKFWEVNEVISEFMSTAADERARRHYGLFTALGSGIDQAFATDDATTFNAAAATILRNLRAKGLGVGANAQFDIVCAPEKLGRILAMLDAQRGSPMIAHGTQKQPIAFSVRNVISTTHVQAADTGYYLVLPGRKIKRGAWKDLTIESKRDIAVSAEDIVGVEQYNAAIGETDQVRRVKYQ